MKRLMATALVAAMGLTMLGGCGVSKDDTTEIQASKTDKTDTDKNKEVGHPWIMKNSALDQAGFGQSHEFLRAESVEEILKKL